MQLGRNHNKVYDDDQDGDEANVSNLNRNIDLEQFAMLLMGGKERKRFFRKNSKSTHRQLRWEYSNTLVNQTNYLTSKNLYKRDVQRIILVCRSKIAK